MFIKLVGVAIVFLVVKGYIEKIAAYLQFRWNKSLNVGVKVFVRGQEGIIENYTLSSIFVRTKDRTIIINMHPAYRTQSKIQTGVHTQPHLLTTKPARHMQRVVVPVASRARAHGTKAGLTGGFAARRCGGLRHIVRNGC